MFFNIPDNVFCCCHISADNNFLLLSHIRWHVFNVVAYLNVFVYIAYRLTMFLLLSHLTTFFDVVIFFSAVDNFTVVTYQLTMFFCCCHLSAGNAFTVVTYQMTMFFGVVTSADNNISVVTLLFFTVASFVCHALIDISTKFTHYVSLQNGFLLACSFYLLAISFLSLATY